jgi:putative tryptophan/tyrosine transport system substrate-binding protein
MKRREFITLVSSAATWPLAARAQQVTKTYHIALVRPSLPVAEMTETSEASPFYPEVFKELRRLGYVEGVNLVVSRYSGEGREERYPELCREVVRANPDVIVTASSRLVLGFKVATATIPVVAVMADPVVFGIVTSIAHPGGNITGVSVEAGTDIWGKRLQVLREAVPTASMVGFLGSRQDWNLPKVDALRETARQLGITLLGPPLESPIQDEEYRRVLGSMTQEHVDGVIIGDQAEHFPNRQLIVDLVRAAQLPTIFPYREYFKIGALMVYGPPVSDLYRRLAVYIDQILKGARPGDLPIYLASKFDFVAITADGLVLRSMTESRLSGTCFFGSAASSFIWEATSAKDSSGAIATFCGGPTTLDGALSSAIIFGGETPRFMTVTVSSMGFSETVATPLTRTALPSFEDTAICATALIENNGKAATAIANTTAWLRAIPRFMTIPPSLHRRIVVVNSRLLISSSNRETLPPHRISEQRDVVQHSKDSALTSAWGQKQTSVWHPLMSALPPKADIAQRDCDVR